MSSSRGRRCFCDVHVPRGCYCNTGNIEEDDIPSDNRNIVWWTKKEFEDNYDDYYSLMKLASPKRKKNSFYFEEVDNNKKRYPCCEYEYDSEGEEIKPRKYVLLKNVVMMEFNMNKYKLSISHSLRTNLTNYLASLDKSIPIEYNSFMSKVQTICNPYFKIGYNSIINKKFYLSLKNRLRQMRIDENGKKKRN